MWHGVWHGVDMVCDIVESLTTLTLSLFYPIVPRRSHPVLLSSVPILFLACVIIECVPILFPVPFVLFPGVPTPCYYWEFSHRVIIGCSHSVPSPVCIRFPVPIVPSPVCTVSLHRNIQSRFGPRNIQSRPAPHIFRSSSYVRLMSIHLRAQIAIIIPPPWHHST